MHFSVLNTLFCIFAFKYTFEFARSTAGQSVMPKNNNFFQRSMLVVNAECQAQKISNPQKCIVVHCENSSIRITIFRNGLEYANWTLSFKRICWSINTDVIVIPKLWTHDTLWVYVFNVIQLAETHNSVHVFANTFENQFFLLQNFFLFNFQF